MTRHETDKKIKLIESMVRKACYEPTNVFGTGIWDHHIKWVVKFGRMMAEETDADMLVVELAALLHDYASIKSFALYTNHHIHGVQEAERILGPMGFDPRVIKEVSHCILTHRGSMKLERNSVEAICVADADAMAHFVGVPSLLHYAMEGKGLTVNESRRFVLAKLERSWSKLSKVARRLAKPYYKAAVDVLNDEDKVTDVILPLKEEWIKEDRSNRSTESCIV